MSLEVSPEVERRVLERAAAAGASASDYLAQLLQATAVSPRDPTARVRNVLRRWQRDDRTSTAASVPREGSTTPSEALFLLWEQEDAGLSEEERRSDEERWREFQRDLDAARSVVGMRPLF